MQATDANDIAKKHLQAVQKHADDDDLDQADEQYTAFRIDSQVRPSNAMLELRFKNENRRAVSYNHLYDVDFEPSTGLVLTFSQHTVEVAGHHLLKLYKALKRHRVVYIWEADHTEANQAANDQPVVKSIDIKELTQ